MFLFSPIDPLTGVLYAAYRLRWVPGARALVLLLGLIPAGLYAMPAQPCSCIRIPFVRCSSYGRERAYLAALKSDLKNLGSQQEIFYSDNFTYSASHEDVAFVTSYGVSVTLFAAADGWAARATHVALPEEACALYHGASTHGIEELADVEPGELVCTM